jgi:O-6-methylguanine DNA methyltransferase
VAHNPLGVSAVWPATSGADFERVFSDQVNRLAVPDSAPPARLVSTIREWLAGDHRHKLTFDLRGLTEFEQAVLHKAIEIPYGQVRPYQWIAREIGNERAVRAVGTALAHNRIPLLIPCHRVVRSDGTLGRYSMISDDTKRTVLKTEGLDVDGILAIAKQGVRYFGSDTTRVFCFPTCRYGKAMMPKHRVLFASEDRARRAGYRPCKVCRPAA